MGKLRIARRELVSLRREKTIVLALAIQLFIAGFSSFLLVGLVSLYDPGSVAGGGMRMGVTGEAGDDLVDRVADEGSWELVGYETERQARRAFDRGRVDAVLIATRGSDGVVTVEALVPEGSVRSTMIVVQVRELLGAYERERREALSSRLTREPVPLPEGPDSTPTFAFTYTVLLPLLMFLPAFISGSVAADAITGEIDAGTLELLRVTPLSAADIVDGKMLAMAGLAPAQAAAWLALLWVNGTAIHNPVALVGVVAAVSVVVVALGAGLAAVLRDRQSTQLVYSLGVLVAFGVASLLPESPPNTVAKLAIGSPEAITYGLVGGYVVAAAAAYLGVRRLVGRSIAG